MGDYLGGQVVRAGYRTRRPLSRITLEADPHQQTALHAIGDVVSDLHQIAVGTGHAAIAASLGHNSLPHNFR
jgi:thioredoxin reductase